MNLGDPDLELVDPTPDVHSLFVHFDQLFFWGMLASRATVRWSKRMYSCAGVCSYDCRSGICDIALSEPLLKLRPRKNLIETLLHEMIHALLFVTYRDQDRDGHGPNFQAHMYRINKSSGLNITIYHNYYAEVALYQSHWWRCDGPCQYRRPHFGVIRRSMNRAPGPNDYWWQNHLWCCGGTFIKIKEPPKELTSTNRNTMKPNGDITKYVISNSGSKPVLKDSGNITANTITNSNRAGVYTINKKELLPKPIPLFTGSGHILNTGSKNISVAVEVKNIWANKEIPTINGPTKKDDYSLKNPVNSVGPSKSLKHKTKATDSQTPPNKTRKIDDYFNSTTILKDLYGDDYKLKQSNIGQKLVAVKIKMVDCPICSKKFNYEEINTHLDECLNQDMIEKLSKDGEGSFQETQPTPRKVFINTSDTSKLQVIIGDIPPIPIFKSKTIPGTNYNEINGNIRVASKITNAVNSHSPEDLQFYTPVPEFKPFPALPKRNDDIIDLTGIDFDTGHINTVNTNKGRRKTESEVTLSSNNLIRKGEEAGSSKDDDSNQRCPICREIFDKPVEEHLDDCLGFLKKYTGDSSIVVIDDKDDILDETQTLNATGTKTLCPCCMKMVEQDEMNDHLDICLGNS